MGKLKAPAFDPKELPETSSAGYPEPYKTAWRAAIAGTWATPRA